MKTIVWLLLAGSLTAAPVTAGPITAAPLVLKVQIRSAQGEKIVEMPLERYVAAVLAGESSVFQSSEALKAMAVAARTYAVRMRGRHSAEGFDLCTTTHCQRLDLSAVTPRLEAAAADTTGELLWYQGKPAFTPYTRDCGGMTEDAGALWPDMAEPYLKSHADPYCLRVSANGSGGNGSGTGGWRWIGDPRDIRRALSSSRLRSPQLLERISIAERTPSGRALTLQLAGNGESIRISAGSFRFAIGRELGWDTIRGDRYEVHASNGRIVFEGAGSGHGVGLCQRGSEQMGLAGRTYRDILAFYYPGTVVGLTGRGISWQRLNGESVSLMTTRPEQDRITLETAERLAHALFQRTRWPLPSGVEIRVYPDLETFRNATAEPGWVAAHTQGRRIHLQPVAELQKRGALEATLSHELLHVLIESRARPGLPEWFREGLVEYLITGRGSGIARAPSDAELRETDDAARARRAYADAAAMVATLVKTYGEAGVLDWVERGLPADVTTKAKTNQATANSR